MIGFELDTRALQSDFEACLLTAKELEAGADGWSRLPDPFPDWNPGSASPREPPSPAEAASTGSLSRLSSRAVG